MDYYLKAADEQSLHAALESAGVVMVGDDGKWTAPGYALDVIGTISRPTGILDAEGNPVLAPLPGYHANLRGELTDAQMALLPLIPAPNNPARVWA